MLLAPPLLMVSAAFGFWSILIWHEAIAGTDLPTMSGLLEPPGTKLRDLLLWEGSSTFLDDV